MSQITYSSVPAWARPGDLAETTTPAPTGSAYLLVGVGSVDEVLDRWESDLAPRATTRITGDVDFAGDALAEALSSATVGVRVWIAADAGAALQLRAIALAAGLEDDEIDVLVAPETTGEIDVFCVHCRAVNRVRAQVDDVVACAGCGRDLLVYHHVSRRTGQYLGFQVDAETAPFEPAPQEVEA
ncbi:dimethylamine monooxygenase subunit DmmA family protein [Gordonia paraffinivorans]|uniref:dimethylamine monooxygenase subunit DmmA family protein n=1 Tax=Gordonia paraffinivorans TaxID=175628 RepID=UPI001445AF89|nr:dimethylamine monooxygenase subunit DmmA family protein [Gordonia paraffinivorans]